MSDTADRIRELRREPPAFRRVAVARVRPLSPRMRRITFAGSELEGLAIDEPAASVRLLIPSGGTERLVMPEWNGNEFLLADGSRPRIRTFTPRYLRSGPAELDLDIVLHGADGASGWAMAAGPGDPAAISGPGRGYEIDPLSDPLLLLGDETAIPAIAQLLEIVPSHTRIVVHLEVAHPDARIALPEHPGATVAWHDRAESEAAGVRLLEALVAEQIDDRARVWAAGEAAGVQRLRKHLAGIGFDRARATVRGYWKAGRAMPG